MAWMFASVFVVLLSMFIVLLVIFPGLRMFCLGAVCMLGVVGLLLYMYYQYTTPARTREQHASTRSREETAGAGPEAAASWGQRSGQAGRQTTPTPQERSEAVSTPEEAAQAVQRRRATQDVQRQGQGEQAALTMPQADGSARPETIAPPAATTAPSSTRQPALSSEDNDALALPGPNSAPATPRVTPIPRVTVIPPSTVPPHTTLMPSADPTPLAPPTPPAPPMQSAPPTGSRFKSCDELKAEIQAKFAAKSLTGYTLTIMPSGDLHGQNVVGSCEGNTKKIVLTRSQNAP